MFTMGPNLGELLAERLERLFPRLLNMRRRQPLGEGTVIRARQDHGSHRHTLFFEAPDVGEVLLIEQVQIAHREERRRQPGEV